MIEITDDEIAGVAVQQELPLPMPTHIVELAEIMRDELDLVTPDLLACTLGVAPQTLAGWRADKMGPGYVKLGKSVFYRRDALNDWIARNSVSAQHGS